MISCLGNRTVSLETLTSDSFALLKSSQLSGEPVPLGSRLGTFHQLFCSAYGDTVSFAAEALSRASLVRLRAPSGVRHADLHVLSSQ